MDVEETPSVGGTFWYSPDKKRRVQKAHHRLLPLDAPLADSSFTLCHCVDPFADSRTKISRLPSPTKAQTVCTAVRLLHLIQPPWDPPIAEAHGLEDRTRQETGSAHGLCFSARLQVPAEVPVPAALDGLQPERWNKPFPSQLAYGHGVCHSNKNKRK